MATIQPYSHNSQQKDYIRNKWIEFAREIYDDSEEFGILTFPAEAMQDIHLFKERGFIDWEVVETESPDGTPNFKITKGNVKCFEKKSAIYKVVNQRLIHAKVMNADFCAYIASEYSRIISGRDKTFPVDVVNLDFEGRLYPNNNYPFDDTIKNVFEFQRRHEQNFSLFLTWPVVEEYDIEQYKNLLHNVIESNLIDASAASFKTSFEEEIGEIENLDYERKSIIGVSKVVIKKASQNLYTLSRNEFFVYGGGDRQRMISLLFNFTYDGRTGRENILYANDVASSMAEVVDINDLNNG